jgi:hypothetical protein
MLEKLKEDKEHLNEANFFELEQIITHTYVITVYILLYQNGDREYAVIKTFPFTGFSRHFVKGSKKEALSKAAELDQ